MFSKQDRAPKVLMQMASCLLGFDRVVKLIQPRITLHLFYRWVWPLWAFHKLVLEPVLELRGCVYHPSSQGRLRLLSGTPYGAMEPLKVATGFGMGEKAPTTEKHFVVILGGTTQFHLGDKPTSALEFSVFQSGMDLRMRVFFQFIHHHLPRVFKQIDRTPFLGTLEPQWTKIGLGVDTFNESMGMKRARFIQELVELGVHLVQYFPFPHFRRWIRMKRPFLHTFFLIIFQGSLHQFVDGTNGRGCRGRWQWVLRSGQSLQSHHEFTGGGLSDFHL